MQAASLVASMHEAAYTIAYVGNDEALAKEWRTHIDPVNPYRSVAELAREAMIKLGVPDPQAEANRRYQKYSQLCWAKHIFPMAELQLSLQVKGGQRTGVHGPNLSEDALRASWFGLENAIWYAYIGMKSFIHWHLSDQVSKDVLDGIQRMVDEYRELANEFSKRWPGTDPFPGKWRDITRRKRS